MRPTIRPLIVTGVLCSLLWPAVARSQEKVIASVGTNMKATADLYECRRKQGVLTVKVRFKASANTQLDLPYAETYVVDIASGKKYAVLRDSDKQVLATHQQTYNDKVHESIKDGESYSVWWKFPAPPASTKQIAVMLPNCEPFEDVSITDAP